MGTFYHEHPELKEGEIFLINAKINEVDRLLNKTSLPEFLLYTRKGDQAYTSDMRPLPIDEWVPIFGRKK